MLTQTSSTYSAPAITGVRDLSAPLVGLGSIAADSDAEIKHNVRPFGAYEAPEITDRAELDAGLANFSLEE